jgi:hypothetical protein
MSLFVAFRQRKISSRSNIVCGPTVLKSQLVKLDVVMSRTSNYVALRGLCEASQRLVSLFS